MRGSRVPVGRARAACPPSLCGTRRSGILPSLRHSPPMNHREGGTVVRAVCAIVAVDAGIDVWLGHFLQSIWFGNAHDEICSKVWPVSNRVRRFGQKRRQMIISYVRLLSPAVCMTLAKKRYAHPNQNWARQDHSLGEKVQFLSYRSRGRMLNNSLQCSLASPWPSALMEYHVCTYLPRKNGTNAEPKKAPIMEDEGRTRLAPYRYETLGVVGPTRKGLRNGLATAAIGRREY